MKNQVLMIEKQPMSQPDLKHVFRDVPIMSRTFTQAETMMIGHKEHIGLVIIDDQVALPLEIIKFFQPLNIPVFLMTSSEELKYLAKGAGIAGIIAEPFDIESFSCAFDYLSL